MKHRIEWHVCLRKTGGSKKCYWPELEHQGKTFVIGTPGQGYSVIVQAPSEALAQGQMYKVSLHVDGRCAGVTRIIRPDHQKVKFHGFTTSSNGSCTEQAFLYGAPNSRPGLQMPETGTAAQPSCPAGKLQVVIHTASEVPRKRPRRDIAAPAAPPAVQQLEGKKFFMAPSLVTQMGAAKPVRTLQNTKVSHPTGATVADILLHLETAVTLTLRFPGLLRPDNAAHQPILQLLHSEERRSATEAPAAAMPSPAANGCVKSEASNAASPALAAITMHKVKQDARPRKRQKAPPACIDLTL